MICADLGTLLWVASLSMLFGAAVALSAVIWLDKKGWV